MTTRILALVGGFALCVLLACGDYASAQPPPVPGTVTWDKDYPKVVDPVGFPMPKQGGVVVYGTSNPANGWARGTAGLFYIPQAGGVTNSTELKHIDGVWGWNDPNGKIVPAEVYIGKGDWVIWVNVVFTRQNNGKTETVIVCSAFKNVTVK